MQATLSLTRRVGKKFDLDPALVLDEKTQQRFAEELGLDDMGVEELVTPTKTRGTDRPSVDPLDGTPTNLKSGKSGSSNSTKGSTNDGSAEFPAPGRSLEHRASHSGNLERLDRGSRGMAKSGSDITDFNGPESKKSIFRANGALAEKLQQFSSRGASAKTIPDATPGDAFDSSNFSMMFQDPDADETQSLKKSRKWTLRK